MHLVYVVHDLLHNHVIFNNIGVHFLFHFSLKTFILTVPL